MVEVLTRPWQDALENLVASARRELMLVSPYVRRAAVGRITAACSRSGQSNLRVSMLTDLTIPTVLDGSLEPRALLDLVESFADCSVSVVPRLHAKVYIADDSVAIVTSANLTEAGLSANHECGVPLRDATAVSQLRADLRAYAALGNPAPRERLEALALATERVRQARDAALGSARRALRQRFEAELDAAQTEVLRTRAEGRTTHGIFCDTVLYILRRDGPLTTRQLHPRVRAIHPDLCDDSIDRIIAGVHFGKRWKHYVRNAQQALKRAGSLALEDRRWRVM